MKAQHAMHYIIFIEAAEGNGNSKCYNGWLYV